MQKLAELIVKKRAGLLAGMAALLVLCAFLALQVPINPDMTKYLPDDSPMKQGMDIMTEEFGALVMPVTIKAMFSELDEEEESRIREELAAIEYVSSVGMPVRKDGYTMFSVSSDYTYRTPEETSIENEIRNRYSDRGVVVSNDDTTGMLIPVMIFVVAVAILLVVLFALSASWAEPFLFLLTIGMAIVINMGTNIFMGSVAQVTYSIGAIIQLVLSMDYSIILMNRYRQERSICQDKEQAMIRAMTRAFSSIASSGFTTFVGLLMMVFMRFKIGLDIGVVLAKGVLISMICVLTVLPGLILLADGLIAKTDKKILHVPTGALVRFSSKAGYRICIAFLVLFAVSYYAQSKADISFSLSPEDPVAEIFPSDNMIIMLYDNADEDAVTQIGLSLDKQEHVKNVISVGVIAARQKGTSALAKLIGDAAISGMRSQLSSENHSLMVINTDLPVESEGTHAFMDGLQEDCETLTGAYYLIGNTPMSIEMEQGFGRELLLITLLTVISIFIVVAVTFRTLSIPVILVSLVQCGVYLTITTTSILGYNMYYLAILIVQCILMGATVDYGILFVNYYREMRMKLDIPEALRETYSRSVHTILTSALFMIFGTGVIGFSPVDPTISQICQSICLGAVSATLLVIFVLPGMLAAQDRFITGKTKGDGSR